ncbi:hypothetical protein C8F01DRAFT_1238485 [Mycena amicta]|nr:hypothetical protein C8F01DRAFT_1238485 [Mycena amicta]
MFNHGHGEGSHDRTRPESAAPGARERLAHKMNLGFLLNDAEPATAPTHTPTYSPMSQSQSQSQSHGKGPRAHMACVACRKRHIKCEATSNARDNTCARCVRKGLNCEYMDAAVEEAMRPPASRRRPATPGPTSPVHLVHPYAGYDARNGLSARSKSEFFPFKATAYESRSNFLCAGVLRPAGTRIRSEPSLSDGLRHIFCTTILPGRRVERTFRELRRVRTLPRAAATTPCAAINTGNERTMDGPGQPPRQWGCFRASFTKFLPLPGIAGLAGLGSFGSKRVGGIVTVHVCYRRQDSATGPVLSSSQMGLKNNVSIGNRTQTKVSEMTAIAVSVLMVRTQNGPVTFRNYNLALLGSDIRYCDTLVLSPVPSEFNKEWYPFTHLPMHSNPIPSPPKSTIGAGQGHLVRTYNSELRESSGLKYSILHFIKEKKTGPQRWSIGPGKEVMGRTREYEHVEQRWVKAQVDEEHVKFGTRAVVKGSIPEQTVLGNKQRHHLRDEPRHQAVEWQL